MALIASESQPILEQSKIEIHKLEKGREGCYFIVEYLSVRTHFRIGFKWFGFFVS